MQLLTLISSTAGNHEVSFSLLLSELKIESSDLEILILEGWKFLHENSIPLFTYSYQIEAVGRQNR